MRDIGKVLEALQKKAAESQSQETRLDGLSHQAETNYFCSQCKDKQGELVIKDGYEYWRQCECIERRKVHRLMKSSEITSEFSRIGFGTFLTENKPQPIIDAHRCALDYFRVFNDIQDKRQNSIGLLGQPGAGKTHLLTAISNNLIQKRHKAVLYFPYVEGFNDLKDDFDLLEEKLERMKTVDVLFIDDLFKPTGKKRIPRATDWQIEQTYAVINYRYLNHKPLLISSELTVDEIVQVDEALATRIYEMCRDFIVVIKGDPMALNHRLKGLK